MSNIKVDISKLKRYSSDINGISKLINSLKQQLDKCNNSLSSCLSYNSYTSIRKNLCVTSSALLQQISNLKSLSSGLGNIANTYLGTESQIKSIRVSFMNKNDMYKKAIYDLIHGGSVDGRIISSLFVSASGTFGGIASGKISAGLLEYGISGSQKIEWKRDSEGSLKDAGAVIEREAHFNGANVSAEGNIGNLSGAVTASVLNASVNGGIGATLFQDGKLSPAISAELKGKVNVAEGEVKAQYGDKYNNVHAKASGEVLGAKAEASGQVGFITYENANGETVRSVGVQGKVGAEAYAAQGTISGGVSIFGLKVDASVSGKAGGAGVSASGQVTGNGASGSIGAGLGVGAGIAVSVDWSGAVENAKEHWDDISSSAIKGWNSIKDGVSKFKFW